MPKRRTPGLIFRGKTPTAPLRWIATVILPLVLSGCATPPPAQSFGCELQAPPSVERLGSHSRQQLIPAECSGKFPEYLQLSLNVAELTPSKDNREKFAEFLNSSARDGLLSEHEAKLAFNRYFHTTFISLPTAYNLCSVLRQQSELTRALEQELEDKRRGMLVISADPQLFAETQRQYADLSLILDAVALACVDR